MKKLMQMKKAVQMKKVMQMQLVPLHGQQSKSILKASSLSAVFPTHYC